MTLTFRDPRTSRRLQVLLERRDKAVKAQRQPLSLRGTVLANDAANERSTMRFVRAGGVDDIPVPWSSFTPTVGADAFMRYEPTTGDAYIEKQLIDAVPEDDFDPDEPVPDPPPPLPDPEPGEDPFPVMSMWRPYWQNSDLAKTIEVADDMVYMQQKGVVLMGMQWGPDYALPDDVSDHLDEYIERGIQPFLGLWVGHLDIDDQTVAQQAIDAGEGKWAGIILDAESQWVNHVKEPPEGVGAVQAKADFDAFMAIVRPQTDRLGVACYASPTTYPNYKYPWWNEVVDFFMPLAYFNAASDTPEGILDTMYQKFSQAHANQGWTEAIKPIIPVMNGYQNSLTDADVAEREQYIELAFERAGAVSIWRWIGDTSPGPIPENMREMLHSIEVPVLA